MNSTAFRPPPLSLPDAVRDRRRESPPPAQERSRRRSSFVGETDRLLRMTVQQSDLNSRHSLPVSAAEKRHARTVDGGAHRNRQSQVEHDHAVFFRRQGVPRTESNARNRPDVTGKRRCRDRAPRAKEEQSRTTHHPNTNLPILGIFRPQTETRDDRTNVETAVRAMVTGVRQCGFRAAATGQRIRIWIRYVP